jgi:hypothetical protein
MFHNESGRVRDGHCATSKGYSPVRTAHIAAPVPLARLMPHRCTHKTSLTSLVPHLLRDDGQHLQVDAVELIEAGPRAAAGQALEELAHGLRRGDSGMAGWRCRE